MSTVNGTVYDALTRTVRQGSALAASILELAAAEVGGSVGNLAKGIGAAITGLAIALVGLLFLLHAAVYLLVRFGWSEAASYAMVGGGTIILGLLFIVLGVVFLRGASPVPHRAIQEVRSLLGQEDRLA